MAYINGSEDFLAALTGSSVFIRYSENADGSNSSKTWRSGMDYMGVYVGQNAPADESGYQWIKFVGEGVSSVLFDLTEQVSVATAMAQGGSYSVEYDTTELRAQLRKGAIKIKYREWLYDITACAFSQLRGDECDVLSFLTHSAFSDDPYMFTLRVYDGEIKCFYRTLPAIPNAVTNEDKGKAVIVGDETFTLGEMGGTNIITANSKDELPDPANVPEGTVALVPSGDA